jgi:hypothetical protein
MSQVVFTWANFLECKKEGRERTPFGLNKSDRLVWPLGITINPGGMLGGCAGALDPIS